MWWYRFRPPNSALSHVSCSVYTIWSWSELTIVPSNLSKSVKIAWNDPNHLRSPSFKRQLWAHILTKLHQPKIDSTLFFWHLSSGVDEFCYRKSPNILVFCSIYCRDHIYDIYLFGKFLPLNSRLNKPNFYVHNIFELVWCWFEWDQAISRCCHTFDRD